MYSASWLDIGYLFLHLFLHLFCKFMNLCLILEFIVHKGVHGLCISWAPNIKKASQPCLVGSSQESLQNSWFVQLIDKGFFFNLFFLYKFTTYWSFSASLLLCSHEKQLIKFGCPKSWSLILSPNIPAGYINRGIRLVACVEHFQTVEHIFHSTGLCAAPRP